MNTNRPWIVAAGLSDTGHRRKENQDRFGIFLDANPHEKSLLVIADGMGGAAGGAVASQMALDTIRESVGGDGSGVDPASLIREGFERANRAIHERATNDPRLFGMGTTCTTALLFESGLYLGHVGDSRAYLIRSGEIRQLTQDHTIRREAEALGQSPGPAGSHPYDHVLSRSVGVSPSVRADVSPTPLALQAGDRILLCTDGVSNSAADDELLVSVRDGDPETGCRRLIDLALARGGKDNCTAIVARIES